MANSLQYIPLWQSMQNLILVLNFRFFQYLHRIILSRVIFPYQQNFSISPLTNNLNRRKIIHANLRHLLIHFFYQKIIINYFFLLTPTVFPFLPVVQVFWPLTLIPHQFLNPLLDKIFLSLSKSSLSFPSKRFDTSCWLSPSTGSHFLFKSHSGMSYLLGFWTIVTTFSISSSVNSPALRFRSMLARLRIKLEIRRPIPLMAVKANITFCLPLRLVFKTRMMWLKFSSPSMIRVACLEVTIIGWEFIIKWRSLWRRAKGEVWIWIIFVFICY